MMMMMIMMIMMMIVPPAVAQISPGKLSRYHAAQEGLTNCTKCHELGREVSNARCLACHTTVARRREAKQGLHGQPETFARKCKDCHFEHHGENFEIVHWEEGGKDRFDHARTGWPLEGAHRPGAGRIVACKDCHRESLIQAGSISLDSTVRIGRTFLGLGQDCIDCHQDEHRGNLGEECLACHTLESWQPATKFVHDRSRYSLTGKHRQVECAKCHTPYSDAAAETPTGGPLPRRSKNPVRRYRGLEYANCASCHADPHLGRLGGDCKHCHNTDDFRQVAAGRFDHDRTAFPLTGKHKVAECASCHTSDRASGTRIEADRRQPLQAAGCAACHRDFHQGQFATRPDGGRCESCHTTDGFSPSTYRLEQHQGSRFPLTGAHLATPCLKCHRIDNERQAAQGKKMTFRIEPSNCVACHPDPHRSEVDRFLAKAGCEKCHTTEHWRVAADRFDHDIETKFPLSGRHRTAACRKCHEIDNGGSRVLTLKSLQTGCQSCHMDVHRGQFAPTEDAVVDCSRCHLPDGWKVLTFDHNRQSRFTLAGAHSLVACKSCHKPDPIDSIVRYKPLPIRCEECHKS